MWHLIIPLWSVKSIHAPYSILSIITSGLCHISFWWIIWVCFVVLFFCMKMIPGLCWVGKGTCGFWKSLLIAVNIPDRWRKCSSNDCHLHKCASSRQDPSSSDICTSPFSVLLLLSHTHRKIFLHTEKKTSHKVHREQWHSRVYWCGVAVIEVCSSIVDQMLCSCVVDWHSVQQYISRITSCRHIQCPFAHTWNMNSEHSGNQISCSSCFHVISWSVELIHQRALLTSLHELHLPSFIRIQHFRSVCQKCLYDVF